MPFDFGPSNRGMGLPQSGKGNPTMQDFNFNDPNMHQIMPVPAPSGPGQFLPSTNPQLPPQAGMARNFPRPQLPNMNPGGMAGILARYRNNPMPQMPQMPQMPTPYMPSFEDLMSRFDKRMGMFG